MSETLDWDSFANGDFVKFDTKGTNVTGTITGLRAGTDFNGGPCPVLDLNTPDGPRTVSCGQANLKAQIVALKPKAGQEISITFASEEKAEKGMRKMFSIEVTEGNTPPF